MWTRSRFRVCVEKKEKDREREKEERETGRDKERPFPKRGNIVIQDFFPRRSARQFSHHPKERKREREKANQSREKSKLRLNSAEKHGDLLRANFGVFFSAINIARITAIS